MLWIIAWLCLEIYCERSVVLSYNIPNLGGRLVLTQESIVGIYNGTIRKWDHPLIQNSNQNLTLPRKDIIAIGRMDKSGTTEIFTSALSAISPEWNATYGTFSTGRDGKTIWNASVVKYFGYEGRGMSGLVLSFRYSIGYLSLADADEADMTYAYLINSAGNAIAPTANSVQNAMNEFLGSFDSRFTTSIINAPGNFSYPLATYSYFIIYKTGMKDCEEAAELARFIEWCMHDEVAQRICDQRGMVCISRNVAKKIEKDILQKLECGEGVRVYEVVQQQKHWETISLQTWRKPLFVLLPLVLILLVLVIGHMMHNRLRQYRRIIRGEWKIDQSDLTLIGSGDSTKSSSSVLSSSTLDARHSMRWAFSSKTKVAIHNGVKLMLQETEHIPREKIRMHTMAAILYLKDNIKDVNVCRFHGLAIIDDVFYFAREFCAKGVLQEILQDDKLPLDINFKHSMAIDICQGMVYLERKGIIHGYLSSQCCYLDGRWNVKIADWEISKIQSIQLDHQTHEAKLYQPENYGDLFWTAPEVLKSRENLSGASDVYSFAIIVYEIFTRDGPYDEYLESLRSNEVVQRIIAEDMRPQLKNRTDVPEDLQPVLEQLWTNSIESRPNFAATLKLLTRTQKTRKCVLDCMMDAMTAYMNTLEEKVNERTKELEAAMTRVQTVLHQILPPAVADKLASGEQVPPEHFESSTVFFSDIVGFTSIASLSTPLQVVDFLNSLYTKFDSIIDQHDVYKVETIGDAYMVISGLPKKNGIAHVHHIANMALDFTEAVATCSIPHMPKQSVQLRGGFHSGPVTAGVVGVKMPRYCLFGDTVNVASRMESTSLPMRIQISPSSQALLSDIGGFVMQERGETEIKVGHVPHSGYTGQKVTVSFPNYWYGWMENLSGRNIRPRYLDFIETVYHFLCLIRYKTFFRTPFYIEAKRNTK